MQTLGLAHADVGGWSMGGWVALKLTVDHPALVDRLVVYDTAGIYFPATFNASLFTPTDSAGLNRLIDILTPDPKPLPAFAARAAIRKLQANAWVLDRSVDSMIGGHDLLDFQLYQIHVPVLIVWGQQDQLIPLAVGESIHHRIPGSSLFVVQGCGPPRSGRVLEAHPARDNQIPLRQPTTRSLRAHRTQAIAAADPHPRSCLPSDVFHLTQRELSS